MTTIGPSNKNRTSLCKEWEKNRRNKFNDAIAKLGEIVRAVNKSNEPNKELEPGKDGDNVKYAKVEIVQKAIMCLTNCAQEKTQLKAEILALRVKLEATTGDKTCKKDVSTQVHFEINKKSKNGKYVKVLMMQKSKRNDCKEKPRCLKENKIENSSKPKLPNILPRCNIFNKKVPDNAIVVLPAAPYIFPQRQLLFPTVPPAIVLVDHNMQTLNKSVPIVSRNSGEITRTTMVNILPISAYSRPLSATTNKKNVRLKADKAKKSNKKNKPVGKSSKEPEKSSDDLKSKNQTYPIKENKNTNKTAVKNITTDIEEETKLQDEVPSTSSQITSSKKETHQVSKNVKLNFTEPIEKDPKPKNDVLKIIEKPECLNTEVSQITEPVTTSEIVPIVTVPTDAIDTTTKTADAITKPNKCSLDKNISSEEKDKDKLPNILDTTLCDGGNARLELAEEFLAASPTAAFLMSFPLVSGNRADSPAEEPQTQSKDSNQKRHDLITQQLQTTTNADTKVKTIVSKPVPPSSDHKINIQEKHVEPTVSKAPEVKTSISVTQCNATITSENPFLSLPMPSLISTNCTLSDTTFGLDFECNLNKPSQPSSYVSNSNIFYKNDPFSTVKSTIYSTSSISSSHEFNSLGLYPCAMEKYTSKNKSEFANMDDSSLMKMGSSRLTYDIDLGWSHKGFDFVNCTTSAPTFAKDTILTTVSSTPFSTSYNPFNPEFHVPLVSSASKKDVSNKTSSSFADTITNFYSQPSNLWTEEPFYTNSNVSKTLSARHQNYLPLESIQTNTNVKPSNIKHYEVKDMTVTNANNGVKSTNHSIGHQLNEKYTKKSPSKMHINWMTSEIRPMQNNCNTTHSDIKEPQKLPYTNKYLDSSTKRHDNNESNNYFPLSMHNFPTQTAQEEFQVWPSVRPLGTTEISIDPPPINLPTLVGDLALGPHDKKKNLDSATRPMPQQDLQNCTNFFSVTQLMNRTNDNLPSRYQTPQIETTKSFPTKQNISHYTNDSTRKVMPSRVESHIPHPYVFNDPKPSHSYENMAQFSQIKTKANSKPDKSSKSQKNNYSAEALLRGGNFTQKIPDSSNKFLPSSQKYGDFNAPQDTSVAQVSHFPPIIDYSENSYTGQQFSGTSLYNTTTNTISNTFYSNFMPGSSNLMSSNYGSGPFTGEFIDYNQSTECNYSNHKYEELKMRNNPPTFHSDKVPSNYKSSRRESATKHKLECSKKESSKKYQSKRTKLNNDVEEWNEPGHTLWQNKGSSRKHPNMTSEELPFPNYVSNQVASQYQPDFFNSHLMPSNMQPVGHNVDRFPITSRANFNLSTLFPEITMKVQ